MNPFRRALLPVLLALVGMLGASALLPSGAAAQYGNAITASPSAVELRPIWTRTGDSTRANAAYGYGFGGLGDIFGTGRSAWAILDPNGTGWQVFASDSTAQGVVLDNEPRWIVEGTGLHPIVGDFWGSGHDAIGFTVNYNSIGPLDFHLFRTDAHTIANEPSAIIAPRRLSPPVAQSLADVIAADLDGDGDDEMIVYAIVNERGGIRSTSPEIWIYEGGPHFGADAPTMILNDPRWFNRRIRAFIETGDLDGDGHPEIITTTEYDTSMAMLRIYWGTGDLADYADPSSRRDVDLGRERAGVLSRLTRLQSDGDGVADLVLGGIEDGVSSSYLFRSGAGKSARTRSYTLGDADAQWPGLPFSTNAGPLNDTTRRYDMLLLEGTPMQLFSGGAHGVDPLPAATISSPELVNLTFPIADVNGDGWSDLMTANYLYGSRGQGIVTIFAGGPYIPPAGTSGVERVAVGSRTNAIALWPNPAQHMVNIVWRGDLLAMPRRFAVHDMRGARVAHGEVEPGSGAAVWDCRSVPPGAYLVSIYDAKGSLIATTRIIKQDATGGH